MRKVILATALTLMCSSAFAQTSTGPAPQGDNMTKPGMSNGTMDNGSMNNGSTNTTGMDEEGRHVQVTPNAPAA